jgi:transcriptional regulator with XRE-family HTH domain
MNTIGERIRTLRRARFLTLAQVAQRIGKTHVTLSLYERDKKVPSTRTQIDIAHALGIPVRELWGDLPIVFKEGIHGTNN